MDATSKQAVVSNEEYKNFKKYVKNKVKFERDRFTSVYEEE